MTFAPRQRLGFSLGIACALACVVVVRAMSIQLRTDERFETLGRKQFKSKVLVRPRRGMILDRNGEALAVNSDIESLAVNPSQFSGRLKESAGMMRRVAQALRIPERQLQKKFQGNREFGWLKRHLSENELQALRSLKIIDRSGSIVEGLWLVKEAKRVYPHHELAAHVLGSVDLDSQGVEGLELSLNSRLEGQGVKIPAVRDALGRAAFFDAEVAQEMKNGENVSLTIDAPLQFGVETELKNAVKKNSAKGGTVIVMNSETGEIVAMANEPSFDPNLKESRVERRRNRAVTDGYEPGSTVKPILLATALTQGWKLTDRLHGDYGSTVVGGHRISEARASERFEWLSLQQMVAKSSNVVAAKLAMKLGQEKVEKGYRLLGLGVKTGIDFPGEITGRLGASKKWKPLELATIGFGHGVLVTPIQMIRAYAALANGGRLVTPHLIKDSAVEAWRAANVVDLSVTQRVSQALSEVSQEGNSGAKAVVDGFQIVGKTGTSQIIDPKTGKYIPHRYVTSYIGFARNLSLPLVVYAVLDDPNGLAASNAAPLFHSVFEVMISRFSLERQLAQKGATEKSTAPLSPTDQLKFSMAKTIEPKERALQWVDRDEDGATTWRLAHLEGLTLREALRILRGRDFAVEIKGEGPVVKKQFPLAGSVIAEKTAIRLQLGEE